MATAPLGQPHESLRSIVLARNARGLKRTVAATGDCRRRNGRGGTDRTLPGPASPRELRDCQDKFGCGFAALLSSV
jgi:hypothetical protein